LASTPQSGGAVVAAVDSAGNDNGRLSLSTNTLKAGSLNNTVHNASRSIGLEAGEVSSLDYQKDGEFSRTKSLATLGSGDIEITDSAASDTRMLNTDIENTEVAIYDLESHQGLSGEFDTRLLSEDGRRQIAEDWVKTGIIGNTIELIATTDRVDMLDFFDETAKYHKTYEAVKAQIGNSPELAAMLQDSRLTPAQKQVMLDQVTGAVMVELGFVAHENLMIATDAKSPGGDSFYGFYSEQNGKAYINDPAIESTRDLIATAGHEATHALDDQAGMEISSLHSDERSDTNVYANNFGENLADYTNFALDVHGYDGLALSNAHAGNDTELVLINTAEFAVLDHGKGDFRLTEQQEENREKELAECSAIGCSLYVDTKFSLVSLAQGAAETSGVASGAITQVVDDLKELVRVIDEIVEDPAKAEQAAAAVLSTINRTNQIIEGGQLTETEKQQFVSAVNDVASQILETAEDTRQLDGEGYAASYGEGKKYGVYAASIVPLAKISKYLRSISVSTKGGVDGATVDPQKFDVDAEASVNKALIDDNSPFITKGLDPNSPELQGIRQEIVNEYKNSDLPEKLAQDFADNNISSSKSIPKKRVAIDGEELYKFVPTNKRAGTSSYYFTKQEYKYYLDNPEKLAQHAGLPYQNFVGTYDVYMIKPRPEKKPIVFESKVAEVQQGSYKAQGGAIQTIVPNLKNWTTPEVVETINSY